MLKFNMDEVEGIIKDVSEAEVLPRFRNLKAGEVSFKVGDDPVTVADKASEKALSSRLLDLLPGSKVVGEEEFFADHSIVSRFSGESPVWIIDPIDGTRNFVAGKEVFGIIVALVERNQTVAGWIYHPISKEFVTAEKGAGSYHKGRKLSILHADSIENMVGNLGFMAPNAVERRKGLPKGVKPQLEESMWCLCHEYARVSVDAPHFTRPGRRWHFRGYMDYNTPWDDSAGILVHQEAGGYSAHWDGEPFDPSSYHRGVLIAPDRDSWEELKNWAKDFCEMEK